MTKRKRQQGYYTKRMKTVQEGSNEEVLLADIRSLLHSTNIEKEELNGKDAIEKGADAPAPVERFSEIEVKISALSSTGDGLGFSSSSDHVLVVPFTLPGDVVKAKVVTQFVNDHYTLADFISVLQPSPQRKDELVKCPYFAKCSGCQFQMLSYEDQLAHKKTILEKAYRNFSNLSSNLIPIIGDTIGSPLQYGYRTKLTPHFDGPPGSHARRGRKDGSERPGFDRVPPIGFMMKGTRKTMDIEDCPIGTHAVRDGLKKERKRVSEELSKYKRGATLLLRETTTRVPTQQVPSPKGESNTPHKSTDHSPLTQEPTQSASSASSYTETKTYITDQNAISTEHIGPYTFRNPAGAFFQNNNSILQTFTDYIRSHILASPPPTATIPPNPQIKTLIDTYAGSGLFSITLSSLFTSTLGIDISSSSIASATQNLKLNNLGPQNTSFATGDASNIFAAAKEKFHSDECVVVIDPPRKGCDDGFLKQLVGFGPRRVVYVSCNVHTQARDVGVLVRGGREGWWVDDAGNGEKGGKDGQGEKGSEIAEGGGGGGGDGKGRHGMIRYRIESLRGFDFFPQTGHVEGVAILQRVDK
ncbi:MAG: hypothetical protein Q9186_005826 [Xanthomendoza sp. 1 TL-2023]